MLVGLDTGEDKPHFLWPRRESDAELPFPSQADLDKILHSTDRVRVLKWLTGPPVDTTSELLDLTENPPDRVLSLLEDVVDPNEIVGLKACLKIQEDPTHFGFECAASGNPVLEFCPSGAVLVVVYGENLRWEDTWLGDARLDSGWALAQWLARHGDFETLAHLERESERQLSAPPSQRVRDS